MFKIPLIYIFLLSTLIFPLSATDEIRYEIGQSNNDVRMQFKLELLNKALSLTMNTYGDYAIVNKVSMINNFRAIDLLQSGEELNVFIALTNREWEEKTIPVRIPVRRGIQNYRLLLIHEDSQPDFENISSLDELLKMTSGSKYGWTTTEIMKSAGFNVITSNDYDGIFLMLENKRFDFFSRGVIEIYDEIEQKKEILKHSIIETHLALYIPGATYIFVSPLYPELAKRLEEGMEMMVREGILEELVNSYYEDDLKKADLRNRQIISIDNTFLPPETPLHREELWITISDE